MAKNLKIVHKRDKKKQKMPASYEFIKDVRSTNLYKSNISSRNSRSRKLLENSLSMKGEKSAIPGQLIMFNYFTPKTKDELQYYDAKPVTIFFGHFKNKKGEPRVIGFNIHYYPPKMRFKILARVIEIFRPFYEMWQTPLKKEIPFISYGMLMSQLTKAKLDFGVRMYDPGLMGAITPIPAVDWNYAVFTEGEFKKSTRMAIMNYWKNWKN